MLKPQWDTNTSKRKLKTEYIVLVKCGANEFLLCCYGKCKLVKSNLKTKGEYKHFLEPSNQTSWYITNWNMSMCVYLYLHSLKGMY
jgi:hypothetical protein